MAQKGVDFVEEIIQQLKKDAYNSWSGAVGEERAETLEKYLRNKLKEYANVLDATEEEILKAWEKDRNYSVINYYKESNQPALNSKNVKVFETVKELHDSIGKKGFRCPLCEGVSKNPYECNSKLKVDGRICDWKVYGLFTDMGKGVHVLCKDKLKGELIFKPVAWEEE
jgi:hypothetical protein